MKRASAESVADGIPSYLPLLSEIGDLKRVRAAHLEGSVAEALFRRSWAALCSPSGGSEAPDIRNTALGTAASALCSARLGAVDGSVLATGGLSPREAREVLLSGFDAVSSPIPEPLLGGLRAAAADPGAPAPGHPGTGQSPGFAAALARQPRAGATRPGRPRLILEPPESHAEHCATVAVYGVILSGFFEADPAPVFVAGLAHHLHNAGLPDSGFTGEELLGGYLERVAGRFWESALAELPQTLREEMEACLDTARDADSPEGRAFHAADVLDRVLQMQNHERQAGFTLDQALDEMDLVHPGPLKEFQDAILSQAGLR